MRSLTTSLLLALLLAACGGGGSSDDDAGVSSPDEVSGGDASSGDDTSSDDELPSGGGSGTLVTSMSPAEEALALEVLDLLNAERADRELAPLALHGDASEVAYQHSLDMDVRDFFSHTNPDGQSPGDRIAAAGIANWGWGENIAYGYWSPTSVMVAWMNSDGHRANILDDRWTHVGIGVHDAPGGPWWTQVFLLIP